MGRFIISFFRFFDITRKILINLIFWGIVAGVVVFYVKGNYLADPEEGTVLLFRPAGIIVEHSSVTNPLSGGRPGVDGFVSLRMILDTLDAAASDDKISAVLLDLRMFGGSGLSKLQEISASLGRLRSAGKKVIAFSDYYTQGSYYLASHAETVVIDPLGELMFTGFGNYRNYFGKGFNRYGIDVNVFRTGEYKSAVEPYMLGKMSEKAREASADYINDLWEQYLSGIAEARGIGKIEVEKYIKSYARVLSSFDSDSAGAAISHGFADAKGAYDSALELAGDGPVMDWEKYYRIFAGRERKRGNTIAVVLASGQIVPGSFPPGMIGSASYSKLIEKIGEDDDIKALVLRIDSGGGSASASEEIRRALVKFRETGRPVVVSMSSAAASGAYWISCASDEILCMPSTLTGSIGVFSMLPDLSDFLERYPGITADGYGTTEYSHMYRPDMEMTENMKKVMQMNVEKDYSHFLSIVSESRGIDVPEAENLAGGRVWSGEDALANRLADTEGGLAEAVKVAAGRASIDAEGEDGYTVRYFEPDTDWQFALAQRLSRIAETAGSSGDAGFARDSRFHTFAGNVLEYLAGIFGSNAVPPSVRENRQLKGSQALYTGSLFLIE